MKCPSCKYENRYQSQMVDEVVYFKSGKRKGEIKEVVQKTVEFYKDDPEFIEITTQQGDEFKADIDNDWLSDKRTVDLYACPKCGTVIVQQINENT